MSNRVLTIALLSCSFYVLHLTFAGFSGAFVPVTGKSLQGDDLQNGSGRSGNLIKSGQVRQTINQDKTMVLVDVRLPASYQQYRIPDSLNIPLALIRTKGFLANKSIVLINNGFQRNLLNSEIDRLEFSGFSNVAILAGGITGWRRTGGSVDGDILASRKSMMVSPTDFYTEQRRSGLVIVNATGRDLTGQKDITQVVNIPFNHKDRYDLRDKVITAAVPHSQTGLPDVLIFTENADEYHEIEPLLADIGVNIFFLEGGLAAYRDFLKKREKLKSPKTVASGDSTCPICPK